MSLAICIYHDCPVCNFRFVGTNPRKDTCPNCLIYSWYFSYEWSWTREEIEGKFGVPVR